MMSELEKAVEKAVDKRVKHIRNMMVPHHCFTCKWFILRTEKPRNRVCKYPDDLKVVKGMCVSWELQSDSSQWVVNKNMGQ